MLQIATLARSSAANRWCRKSATGELGRVRCRQVHVTGFPCNEARLFLLGRFGFKRVTSSRMNAAITYGVAGSRADRVFLRRRAVESRHVCDPAWVPIIHTYHVSMIAPRIARAVTDELENPDLQGLTSVVMVGGFSGSVHLQVRVHRIILCLASRNTTFHLKQVGTNSQEADCFSVVCALRSRKEDMFMLKLLGSFLHVHCLLNATYLRGEGTQHSLGASTATCLAVDLIFGTW